MKKHASHPLAPLGRFAIVIAALALAACGRSDAEPADPADPTAPPPPAVVVPDPDPQPEPEPGPEPEPNDRDPQLRVLHLSPDAPNVDAFVDGQGPAVSNLPFLSSTDTLTLPAGVVDLQVAAAGAPASSAVLSLDDVRLEEGGRYTAIAFGSVSALDGNVIIEDTQGLASNQVRVRVVHTAFGVGTVDVYAVDGASSTPIAENLFYGSTAAPLDIPAQSFVAGIDVDDDGSSDLLFNIPALSPGTNVNVFAVADGADVFLLAQLPGDTTVRIDPVEQGLRVLHLSPNAPPVIPVVDGTTFGQVSFSESTDYAPVGSATATLDVTLDSTLATSVLSADLELDLGKRYTAVAFDNVANLSATFFEDDAAGLLSGEIRVRAIHGAPSVGQVDIYAMDDDGGQALILENVDFGDVAAPLDLPAGAYTLGVDADDDALVDLMFALPNLDAGTLANVYVTEDASGAIFALAQLDGAITARIDAAQSQVRVLHLSRDAPNVDVFLGGARAISNLAFKQQSDSAAITSSGINVAVAPANAGIHTAVIDAAITFMPGRSYTIVAYDDVANIKPLVLIDDDGGIGQGNIRLPLSHVAPLVTRGDVFQLINGNAFGAQLVDDFGFGETQLPSDLPAAAYTIGFDANAIGVVAARFDLPLVTPGTFARGFVFNERDGGVSVLVQLPAATLVVPAL
jgi:hypothetical protein